MLLLSLPPSIKISTLLPHCHFKITVLTRRESSWSLENITFSSSYLEYTSWLLFPKLSPFALFPYNAKVVQFLLFKRSIEWILIKKIHYKLFQWFWHCVLSKLKVEKTGEIIDFRNCNGFCPPKRQKHLFMYGSMKKDMGSDDWLWPWLKIIGETRNISLLQLKLATYACTSNWFFKAFNSLFQKCPFFLVYNKTN